MGMKREKEEKEEKKTKKKGRRPCCVREGVTKGAWTADEDKILVDFITQNGHGTWRNLPKLAGFLLNILIHVFLTNYFAPNYASLFNLFLSHKLGFHCLEKKAKE